MLVSSDAQRGKALGEEEGKKREWKVKGKRKEKKGKGNRKETGRGGRIPKEPTAIAKEALVSSAEAF